MKRLLASTLLSLVVFASTAFAASTPKTQEEIAAFIGISVEQLLTELQTGLTIQEVAVLHGVDKEALRDFLNSGEGSVFSILIQDDTFAAEFGALFGITASQVRAEIRAGLSPRELAEKYDVEMVIVKGFLITAMAEYHATH